MSDPLDRSIDSPGDKSHDTWNEADLYHIYMGRWSQLVSERFLAWLAPARHLRWLDVGCGSGALSEIIHEKTKPASLVAIDRSGSFVRAAQIRLGDKATCMVADALSVPLSDDSVDIVVSGLVLNFVPDPIKALTEMKRVVVPGGTVATYVWDYAEQMEFLSLFWDAVVEIDPSAFDLHEGSRFRDWTVEKQIQLYLDAGLSDVHSQPLEIITRFRDFDDYWRPFLGGQGPAPAYLMSLKEPQRRSIKQRLLTLLPFQSDGSIELLARAWGVRGQVK